MSRAPLPDAELERLRTIVEAARTSDGRLGDRARLATAAAALDGGLTIDLSHEPAMVVVQVPPQPDPAFEALTPREREVAALLARGLRNRDIATALDIALGTVKDHVHRILDKTGLDSRAAVAAAWLGG